MAWELISECLDRADWKEEVGAMMDLVQCPLAWSDAWRVLALGAGGMVVVGVAGCVWWRCRGAARFRPLAGSTPILRRVGPPYRGVEVAAREEQESTLSTFILGGDESGVGQVCNNYFDETPRYLYKITLYPAKGGRDQGWSMVGVRLCNQVLLYRLTLELFCVCNKYRRTEV